MRVFESVINADRLIHGLFAGTDVTANVRRVVLCCSPVFPEILEDIRAVESQLAGLVSAPEQKVTSTQSVQQRIR